MLTPRPSPVSSVADDPKPDAALPAELEARIAAAAAGGEHSDFDAVSWAWMVTLGLLMPIALIFAGWWIGGTP